MMIMIIMMIDNNDIMWHLILLEWVDGDRDERMGTASLNWALCFAQPRNAEGEYDDDGHDNDDANDDYDDKERHNVFQMTNVG